MKSKIIDIYQSVDFFEVAEIDKDNTVILTEGGEEIFIKWSKSFHWVSCALLDDNVDQSEYESLLKYNNLTPDMNELILGINENNKLVILKQIPNDVGSDESILAFYHSVLEWKLAFQKKKSHSQSIHSNFIKG